MNGENLTDVTKELFWKRPSRFAESALYGEAVLHQMWILPALFYGTKYINDALHIEGDEALESERARRAQKNDVGFNQNDSLATVWHSNSIRF